MIHTKNTINHDSIVVLRTAKASLYPICGKLAAIVWTWSTCLLDTTTYVFMYVLVLSKIAGMYFIKISKHFLPRASNSSQSVAPKKINILLSAKVTIVCSTLVLNISISEKCY